MANNNTEILDNLIAEGESLTPTIKFVPAPSNIIRLYSLYRSAEDDRYQNWQSSVQRFIKSYHPSDIQEIKEAAKELNPGNHRKILGILRAIKILPTEPAKAIPNKMSPTNNILITNNQNNSQQLTVNLFLDAIKDELTGKDFREIKEILKNFDAEPVTTKTKLIEKIKSFGGDVLSNIVANILTNPTVYPGLF